MPRSALTRAVAASFDRAISEVPPDPAIDVARARLQHAAYVAALRQLGLDVTVLPADDRFPDGCFVEDCAVVAGGHALIARSAAPARQGEEVAVADALRGRVALHDMEAPATLDGGDCLLLGRRLYIGRSRRSNDAGIARAAEVFSPLGYQVVPVALPPGLLHLKSACSPLGDDRLLLAESLLGRAPFAGVDVVTVPAEEARAANCLAVGSAALVAEGCPRAREAVEAAGLRTLAVPTSEVNKADGALTCLSILL